MREHTVNLGIKALFRPMAVHVKASTVLQIMIIVTSPCAECCNIVCISPDKQISKIFEGFFKDKLQFSRTKIYSINQHSLTPFEHIVAKTSMESFTIFISSAVVDHIILYNSPQQCYVN